MIQSPGILLTVLAFALVIGPLVFLHELGHYLAGRWFGVKIDAFSIGFGKELFGWTDRRGTRWKFSVLPLGGYVMFGGDRNAASMPDAAWLELPPEERNATLQGKPVWQRAIVSAAGPLMNFLVAIVILSGFAYAFGDPSAPAVAGPIQSGSPAAVAQLRAGDRILAFDGHKVATFNDMVSYVGPRTGKPVHIDYERDGVRASADTVIGSQVVPNGAGKSITIGMIGIRRSGVSLIEAPIVGVRRTTEIVGLMADGIGQIIVGRRPVSELGGPLRIAQISGEQLQLGADSFVWLIALISINLGFINLLPVPLLDGGHLLFYAIEAIRRRPVTANVQEWAFRGGLAAILALMVMVTINDLGAFGLWKALAG